MLATTLTLLLSAVSAFPLDHSGDNATFIERGLEQYQAQDIPGLIAGAAMKSAGWAAYRGLDDGIRELGKNYRDAVHFQEDDDVREWLETHWDGPGGPKSMPIGEELDAVIQVLRLPYVRQEFVPKGFECRPAPTQGYCPPTNIMDFAKEYRKSPKYGKQGAVDEQISLYTCLRVILMAKYKDKLSSDWFIYKSLHDIIKKFENTMEYGICCETTYRSSGSRLGSKGQKHDEIPRPGHRDD